MRSLKTRVALIAACACAFLAPAVASASSSEEEIEAAVGNGVGYIEAQQEEDGSFAGFGGNWALSALAAAGVAAADVEAEGEAAVDARSWYRGLIEDPETWPGAESPPVTEFARAALLSYAAGIDPARVSEQQNLLARTVAQYQPASPGYYGATFNGTVFALLAIAGSKTTEGALRFPQSVLDETVEAIEANQHTDGGWTWQKAAGDPEALAEESEVDMTGAALAALCEAGLDSSDEAVKDGRALLESLLEESGAFYYPWGVNTDSNAWAVHGLNACGIDAQGAGFTGEAEATPIDFLISQQLEGGGFKYLTGSTGPNLNSTQAAVRALAGGAFTATPPTPESAQQWVHATAFGESSSAPLALVVDDGSSLAICSVSVAPESEATTLAAVLDAAVEATEPAECVTEYAPTSGKSSAIAQVNGVKGEWTVSIDGGSAAVAKRNTAIHLGDTIHLKVE